jgi:predicted enzyme related to lactoylglutathione lyase
MAKKTYLSRRGAPIAVRAVDFVMYNAKNVRKTRDFYQKIFGLKKGDEWNEFWSEFKTEPVTFCLNGPSKPPRPGWDFTGPPCLALAVDDVRQAVATCKKRRVKVLIPPIETSVCWMAWVEDPDGNRICLHQRKDGSAG